MVVRKVQTSLAVIFLLLLSLGGFFILFNNIFLGVVYLLTLLTLFLLIYSHLDFLEKGDQGASLRPAKFVSSVIYVTFVVYLFFILFTVLFAGEKHLLAPSVGFGLDWLTGDRLTGRFTQLLVLVVVAFLVSSLSAISFSREDK